jgi:hypothetical protein
VSKQINHQISIFHCQVLSLETNLRNIDVCNIFPSQKPETWQNRVRVSGVTLAEAMPLNRVSVLSNAFHKTSVIYASEYINYIVARSLLALNVIHLRAASAAPPARVSSRDTLAAPSDAAAFIRVQHRMDKLAAERESFLPHSLTQSVWTKTGQRALSTRKYTTLLFLRANNCFWMRLLPQRKL